MVKIDASEYEANWLIDQPQNSGNSATPEEVDEAGEQGDAESSSDTPTESEEQAKQAVQALKSALSSDRGNSENGGEAGTSNNSAPSEKVRKEWIPYRGPQGGEGWQNTEDPEDIRYGLDEPPGEVAEGYEEMAEQWGSEEGSGAELSSFLEEIGHGDLAQTMADGINNVAESIGESPNEVADRLTDRLQDRQELAGNLDQATGEQLANLASSMLDSIQEEIEEERARDELTEVVEGYDDELTSTRTTQRYIDQAVERVQEETDWTREELREDLLNHLTNENVDPSIALDEDEGLAEWANAKVQEAEAGADSPSEVPAKWGQPEEVTYGEWQEFDHDDEAFLETGDRVRGTRNGNPFEGEIVHSPNDGLVGIENEEGNVQTVESWDINEYQSQDRDKDEVRAELRDHFDNIGRHSKALEEYTGQSHREINGHMREIGERMEEQGIASSSRIAHAIMATADEDTAETIRMVQASAKMDLPRTMNVSRGIDVDAPRFLDKAEQAMEQGGSLVDEGFQSATIDQEVAEGFGNVTLDIETDHGVYARAASQFAGEDEILLPAGTRYEVKDVDRENNTVSVEAHGGFKFNQNVDHIRELIHEEGMTYQEALEYVR